MNLLSECCCSTEASNSVPRIYTCGWLSQQCSGPKSPRIVHSVHWCGVGCVMEVIFVICGTRRIIWDNEQIGRHTSYSEHCYNVSCGGRPRLFRKIIAVETRNKYSKLETRLLKYYDDQGQGMDMLIRRLCHHHHILCHHGFNGHIFFHLNWLTNVYYRHKMPWYKNYVQCSVRMYK